MAAEIKNILLTGGTGKLGKAIVSSGSFSSLLVPKREIFDITKPDTVRRFLENNPVDAVIHCAAKARMAECQNNPEKAIETNIIGTGNLVSEIITQEKKLQKKIRFVHISTDGVYQGTQGYYSEEDVSTPYNRYGWSKLGAECAVRLLSNFCIIRTSFFDPANIKFKTSATDAYSSKMAIGYLVKAIKSVLEDSFVGVINIGSERKSDYERYKEFKPSLEPCKLDDILETISFPMAKDASMNIDLWKKLEENLKRKK